MFSTFRAQRRREYCESVQQAMANPNISFRVCQIAMRINKIEKSQLLPGVETVPDGIYELILKQRDQWGYIKVGH